MKAGSSVRRAALLLSASLAAAGICGAETQDGLTVSGQVVQAVSVSTPLGGAMALSGGAASSLALTLEANHESASVRASARISILGGDEAALFWASEAASPSRALWILASPAFNPAAAVPDRIAVLALDELSLRWNTGSFAFEAGKTLANWGVGRAFSPADFFAEFDYSSGTPARLSKLIARATWFPAAASRVDLVYDPYAAEGAALAARLYAACLDSLAFSVAAGLRAAAGASPQKALGAVDASFDLPFASPYGEAMVSVPLDNSSAPSYSMLAGATARIGDTTLLGEYLFSPEAAVRHSIYAQAALKLDDWISLSLPALFYPESGILTAGLSLVASDIAGLDWTMTASTGRSALGVWNAKLAFTALCSF